MCISEKIAHPKSLLTDDFIERSLFISGDIDILRVVRFDACSSIVKLPTCSNSPALQATGRSHNYRKMSRKAFVESGHSLMI